MKNTADAEDCTEDTFVKVLKGDITFKDTDHERAWLTVTAGNLCKDRLKHWWYQKTESIEDYTDILHTQEPEDHAVSEAVMKLPAKYKDIIYLYYSEQEKRKLMQFSKKLKKKEIPFTVMLVPSAAEILTDKLPAFAPHADQKAIIDEADAQTDAVLDISSILKEHAGEDIYYRTDHHWTSLGAYYAYTAWQKKRGFSARSLSEFQKEILCENFRGTTWAKVSLPSKQYMDTITGYYTEKKRRIVYNGGAYITDNIYENEYLKGNDQYGVFFNSNQILTV